MTADFLPLLKKVCQGDEQSWQTLKTSFEDKSLSAEEETQAYAYVKQAARNNVYAIYAHALMYDYGFGVKQDIEMAFLLMREAAGHGHTPAIYEVGRRFLYGIGIERNELNAFNWLSLAAGSPHYLPAAMYELSQMYQQGMGMPADVAKAQEWLEKALAKGLKPTL